MSAGLGIALYRSTPILPWPVDFSSHHEDQDFMTTQSLSRVTLQTLENYRNAADQAVVAYRLGGRRLMGAVNVALQDSVYPRTTKWAPRATDRVNSIRGNVSDIVVKGIDQMANGAKKAIALGSTKAAAQLTKAAEFAVGIDNQLLANSLQAVTRLTMPGARIALAVSSKLAEGAQALADAAGARPVRKAVRKVTPVARKTKVAVKRATQRVAKTVERAVPTTRRVVRGAKKSVAKARAA
jgi:hypothetical protein